MSVRVPLFILRVPEPVYPKLKAPPSTSRVPPSTVSSPALLPIPRCIPEATAPSFAIVGPGTMAILTYPSAVVGTAPVAQFPPVLQRWSPVLSFQLTSAETLPTRDNSRTRETEQITFLNILILLTTKVTVHGYFDGIGQRARH